MSKITGSNSKTLSTWTPLNNDEANKKVYEERRDLFCKWFDKWSDWQRKKIINDVIKMSRQAQLEILAAEASRRLPVEHSDFTRILPRIISLHIFSFLDPRTLSRCSQVCWYWKFLSELDQLWMLKCLRLGWSLPFTPGPYEQGLWKRSYIENFKGLHYLKSQIQILDNNRIDSCSPPESPKSLSGSIRVASTVANRKIGLVPKTSKPAWRGSDPTPKDTLRFNYLNNDDDVEIIKALRTHGLSGPKSAAIASKAKSKVKTGRHILNTNQHERSVTLSDRLTSFTSSSSLPSHRSELSQGFQEAYQPAAEPRKLTLEEQLYGNRPGWARPGMPTGTADSNTDYKTGTVSGISPSLLDNKLRTPVRSDRDLPSSSAFEVFTQRPWTIPEIVDSD